MLVSLWIIASVTPFLFLFWTFFICKCQTIMKKCRILKWLKYIFSKISKGSKLGKGVPACIQGSLHLDMCGVWQCSEQIKRSVGSCLKQSPWPCCWQWVEKRGYAGVVWQVRSVLGSLSTCGFGTANKENFPQEKSQAQEGRTSLFPPFVILLMGVWACVLPTEPLANK